MPTASNAREIAAALAFVGMLIGMVSAAGAEAPGTPGTPETPEIGGAGRGASSRRGPRPATRQPARPDAAANLRPRPRPRRAAR
jgi:hypothetical protein